MIGIVASVTILFCCTQAQNRRTASATDEGVTDNYSIPSGGTVAERFEVPNDFTRITTAEKTFAAYLQNLPLKPIGTRVQYYNGDYKINEVQAAVMDVSVGKRDLQQCADAVIRLRADYFYKKKDFAAINFKLTNGFSVPFEKWIQGYRVAVNGNNCSWILSASEDSGPTTYQKYLDFIFSYAGTLSLAKSLQGKPIAQIEIGDVFIRGGSPGHAIIVVDMAVNSVGKKIFLLAQSYMPAQDIHVLKNLEDPSLSPWYELPTDNFLQTPEWKFAINELKTW